MEEKNNMNTILAVAVCLALIGVLIFISINKKVNKTNMIGNNTEEEVGDVDKTNTVAKSGDTVAMNYTGRLEDGTVFDSNVDPKFGHIEPFVFTLDAGQVIRGWDIGVAGMKVGEKRTLEIAPEFAYGSTGAGGVIPPNATLVFEVELLQIK